MLYSDKLCRVAILHLEQCAGHQSIRADSKGICSFAMQDGVIRNNCFNNTYNLDTYLQSKGVGREVVLYVASSWREANTEIVRKVRTPAAALLSIL